MKERTEVTEARNRIIIDLFFALYLVKNAAVALFCFFPFSCVFAQAVHSAVIELDSALTAQMQTDPLRPRQSVYFLAEPPVEKELPPRIHEHAYELVNTFPRQTAKIERYWLHFNIRNATSLKPELVFPAFGMKCHVYTREIGPALHTDHLSAEDPSFLLVSSLYKKYRFISLEPNSTKEVFIYYQPWSGKHKVDFWLAGKDWYYTSAYPEIVKAGVFQALLLGVFLSVFLYHLIMYFGNATRAFLFYILYCFSLICCFYFHPSNELFQLFNSGLAAGGSAVQIVQLFSGAGMIVFYLFFCVYLVYGDDPAHRLRKYLTLLAYLFTADLCLALIQVAVWGFDSLSYEHHEHPVLAFISIFRATFFWTAMVFIFGVLMYYLFLKDRFLRLLAGSSLFFAVGGLVFALLDYDIYLFSDAGNNYYFFQITSIFQLLTFALLLSYRTRKTEWEKIQLETIDAAKSRFFANVSHEFRTPLTLILGPVSDLLKNKFSPKEHQLLGLIQKNGRRLMRLVNQILDLAKLDSGAMEWNARPGEFVRFTQKITQSFSSFAENRNVRLSFEAHPGELWAVFDADHFEKIIYNLLSNAIKYTPEGGQVGILLHGDYTRKQVVLQVRDTGIGIPEEWLPRIFDRFYQGNSADYTTDLPSTGIGLALTKELVELHGGRITVQSTLRQGSTFTVTFPLQEVEPVQASIPNDPIALAGETAQVFALDREQPDDHDPKPQVLVIEDNEDMLAYIQGRLSNKFDILPARDGKEGVEKAMAQVPDLIVTDVMMPKKDGFRVTQELKEHFTTSHIPIIILTGKSTKESRLYGLEIDADEYLTKPFDAAELEVRIRNLLRNRRRLQAYYSKNFLTRPGDQKATSREEVFLQKVTGLIAENLGNEAFTVEALGQALFIDRTQLYRKLHALTRKSPSRFIRSYRLLRAREFLQADSGTIAEIAFEVGFSSTSYFNRAFKEEFGMTPSQFRASL